MSRDSSVARRKFLGRLIPLPLVASCRSRPSDEKGGSGNLGPDNWFPIGLDSNKLQLQLALSREERGEGLMHRKSLAAGHGMLFLSEKPERQSFWMKNTWIPLDIGFFDSKGVLIEVRKLHPHEEESVKSTSRNILFATELNRNGYRDANAALGAKINLVDLKNALKARGKNPEKHGL